MNAIQGIPSVSEPMAVQPVQRPARNSPSPAPEQDRAVAVLETPTQTEPFAQNAQASMLREGLDLAKDLAAEMINMVKAPQAYQAAAQAAAPSGSLDAVA